jgi:hypothetical protein
MLCCPFRGTSLTAPERTRSYMRIRAGKVNFCPLRHIERGVGSEWRVGSGELGIGDFVTYYFSRWRESAGVWVGAAFLSVLPSALCRGSSGVCDLRWSRIVCPSDFFLRYGVLRCQNSKAHQDCALLMLHSLKRKAPLGPGSRDGLSVHTVRDDSLRETGKLCRETSTLRGRL